MADLPRATSFRLQLTELVALAVVLVVLTGNRNPNYRRNWPGGSETSINSPAQPEGLRDSTQNARYISVASALFCSEVAMQFLNFPNRIFDPHDRNATQVYVLVLSAFFCLMLFASSLPVTP